MKVQIPLSLHPPSRHSNGWLRRKCIHWSHPNDHQMVLMGHHDDKTRRFRILIEKKRERKGSRVWAEVFFDQPSILKYIIYIYSTHSVWSPRFHFDGAKHAALGNDSSCNKTLCCAVGIHRKYFRDTLPLEE